MFKKADKKALRAKRHLRVRKKISGTPERPRLSVYRSEKNIYAQIIDDINAVTLVSASTLDKEVDVKEHRALHGLTRALINNMIIGVEKGYQKTLELIGVGYRAQLQGKKLVMNLGYSHPVEIEPAEGITFETPAATKVVVSGIDKQLVGAAAADIRKWRKPEPYKGKGIKFEGEVIRRKEGKTGKK